MFILLVPSVIAADTPGPEKIVVIGFAYENGAVKELSSEIRYGTPPNLNIQTGTIAGILLDGEGRQIGRFSLRDPRIQIGDTRESDVGTGGGTGLGGYTEENADVEFGVIVPFSRDLASVTLADSVTGTNLATVDLAGPVAAFRAAHPEDPDTALPRQPEPFVPAEIALVGGIALVCSAGAGYLVLLRRPAPTRILIVDDEPQIVDLFAILLSEKGYLPMKAFSGEGCLEALKKGRTLPDAILLDIMMSPLDGWETLERIKKNPAFKNIPVLMLTAKNLTPREAKTYGICIEDYILKPVQPQELYDAIGYVLDRRKAIEHDIRSATRAGYEKDLICEYALLRKQVEVEKKLVDILRTTYFGSGEGVAGMKQSIE
ncbi:MAG: hypothetical protein CW742_14460, partial [Methanoregula sp.]